MELIKILIKFLKDNLIKSRIDWKIINEFTDSFKTFISVSFTFYPNLLKVIVSISMVPWN